MPLGLDQDIHQRAIVEVAPIQAWRDPALVQGPALLDLLTELLEKPVGFDAADDFLFVVERQVAGNRPSQAASS